MAHICPWWAGFFLAHPLRKIKQDPEKILSPYIREGMVVADVGSGMGFFSIPMARLTGPRGRVVCIDIQEKMLGFLKKRAGRAGVSEMMEYRLCTADSLGLDDRAGTLDFLLLFAVLHEVPDRESLFAQISRALKPGGRVLFAEPAGHVRRNDFDASVAAALRFGFMVAGNPQPIWRSHAVLLGKK
jgi:ubiquinone/menaquinone biosynthesis C-methylase UbiE